MDKNFVLYYSLIFIHLCKHELSGGDIRYYVPMMTRPSLSESDNGLDSSAFQVEYKIPIYYHAYILLPGKKMNFALFHDCNMLVWYSAGNSV